MHKDSATGSARTARLAAVVRLLRRERIASQEELVARLRRAGFAVTQATVSRDLRAIGVVRRHAASGDFYELPGTASGDLFGGLVTGAERAANIVVIHTDPGAAQTVARRIDDADIGGLVGTVAGDDTILAVCRSSAHAARLAREWQPLVRSRGRAA